MENRRTPPLNVDPTAFNEQQPRPAPPAPQPRPGLQPVPDTSLTHQSLPQTQGVQYPASSINPPAAAVGYLPSQLPHANGNPSSTYQTFLNHTRPTPRYSSMGRLPSTSYMAQPPTGPTTSGLLFPPIRPAVAPRSRYMDPAIESLMAGYRRHLLDLAPIPITQPQGASDQSLIHDTLADAGSNTQEPSTTVNAWRDEEGPGHSGSLAQNENVKVERSHGRLQQTSRGQYAPLDLSRRASDITSEMSFGPQQNRDTPPSMVKRAARHGNGHLPPPQSGASEQSASLSSHNEPSTSGQSIPTSLKRNPKSASPYSRAHVPNTPPLRDASMGNSSTNNNSGSRFQCAVCHESLRSKDNLKTHMRIHTGERPYACAVCGADFADRSSYAKHVNIHTGQREFTCDMCGKKFTQSGNLARHKKNVHGVAAGK